MKLDKTKSEGRVDSLKVKELRLKKELTEIISEVDETTRESLQLVQELGSGAWLTCLPIQQLGYAYSKQDFRDQMLFISGMDRISLTPQDSVIVEPRMITMNNHILNCKRGVCELPS